MTIWQYFSLNVNGHFPGEPGLASVYWSKGWQRWWWQLDYWSYKSCKAPVKSPPTNQHRFFTGRMSFLLPNQQCQSTEEKNITFHGLAYPKLTWGSSGPTLSLTTNSSWLPWGRVAVPLISSLMPIPQYFVVWYYTVGFCLVSLLIHSHDWLGCHLRKLWRNHWILLQWHFLRTDELWRQILLSYITYMTYNAWSSY